MLQHDDLKALVTQRMPYGKYQGRPLADIPEDYLLWMAGKGFPAGRLGQLLELMLLIRTEGLEYLLKPLKQSLPD